MFRVPIKRASEEELNKAIEDLEKRGFRLVAKKEGKFHRKYFERDRNNKNKHVFSNAIEVSTWHAMMVRDKR